MKKNQDQPVDAAPSTSSGQNLRRRAEERLSTKPKSQRSKAGDQRTAEDPVRLIYELRVHQIELEMQNEELQQARARADALLAQYTDLYDFAPAGYLTLDREGAIRQLNVAGVRLLGVDRTRLVNRRFGLFVAESDRLAFSNFLQKVFASQATESCEVTLSHEHSQPLVVQIESTRAADGQECLTVVLDITERKRGEEQARQRLAEIEASRHVLLSVIEDQRRAEVALSQFNAGLEQRVLDRTTELSAANQELDSFAYAVSHDLRAPLRAMNGFSMAILEDYGESVPAGARGFLSQIRQASQSMGELIDGLLVLSRSTRGERQRDRVDLSAMAKRLCQELARTEPTRTVQWHVEDGLTAWADRRMLEVVMRNLLGNAWKYTGGTPAPSIRVYAEREGGHLFYCIADNGAGFDMRHADRLFKPFQRLHRQDEFPGIGIGLATVQRVVHRHGGTIGATAAVGKGATFRFQLPSASDTAGGVP